jgi:hypothetical protein
LSGEYQVRREVNELKRVVELLEVRVSGLEGGEGRLREELVRLVASVPRGVAVGEGEARPWEAEGISRRTWYRRRKDGGVG